MDLNTFQEGQILLVDKPVSWTSFDVVNKLRYALKIKKIGHSGTLDPLATGLLLIGTGKFTKKLNELQGLDKVYDGIISLGKTTPSYDLETPFNSENDVSGITEADVREAMLQLTGSLEQVPPAHSAIRVNGERAYKKARNAETVELKARSVQVTEFKLVSFDSPDVHFEVICSKGTYIRSLANDLGEILGTGAYLKLLRRTAIGSFELKEAHNLEELIEEINQARGTDK